MEKVTGNVESKSRKGNAIKVGGEWYSTYAAADLNHIEWKDDVEFLYEMKGKYRNIKGAVTKVAGGTPSSAPASKGGGYSNLGVELGHASNLAMRMMHDSEHPVGSAAWIKEFVVNTETMYAVMKRIRAKYESDTNAEAKVPTEAKEASDTLKAAMAKSDTLRKAMEGSGTIEVDDDIF